MNNRDKKDGDTKGKLDEEEAAVQLSLVPYWFLAFLRLILTLLPQTGYIHPDEFFQTIEVINGIIIFYLLV